MPRTCVLCRDLIGDDETVSSYRVEGQCVGFTCEIDVTKYFHDQCLTQANGVNEIARSQVLDYLEQVDVSPAEEEKLRDQNLERVKKLAALKKWRKTS